jgi:hypothetical protein
LIESDLHRYTKQQAKENQTLFYKLECVGKRGFPDLLLVRAGRMVLVELKSPKGTGKLSKLQEREIERLRGAGADVYVASSKQDIDKIITYLRTFNE